jgi:hypothetical protein
MQRVALLGRELQTAYGRGGETASRPTRWFFRQRWWVQVLLVALVARATSILIVLVFARQQGPNPWSPASPGYLDYIDGWDAGWYRTIFTQGYPPVLPRDPTGSVQTNPWAFLPLFPYTIKLLHFLTGVSWELAAPLVSTLASLLASILLYQLFLTRAEPRVALLGVTFFSFQPAAPVLGFGYAESLSFVLLIGILLLVVRQRFLAAIPLVLLLSVCRPILAPLALTLGLLWLHRLLGRPSVEERRNFVGLSVLTAVSVIGMFIWPTVVDSIVGAPGSYLATEMSWHGDGRLLPGRLWATIGRRLFGPVLGLLAPVIFVAGFTVLMFTRAMRRVGPVMMVWTISYVAYLIAASAPNGSVFRLLIPTFPLMLALAFASRSRAYHTTLLALLFVGQVVWVGWLWQWTGVGLHGALEAHP